MPQVLTEQKRDSGAMQAPEESQPGLRIHIPDIFSSIMAIDPIINVHYDQVKDEVAAAVKEYDCLFSQANL